MVVSRAATTSQLPLWLIPPWLILAQTPGTSLQSRCDREPAHSFNHFRMASSLLPSEFTILSTPRVSTSDRNMSTEVTCTRLAGFVNGAEYLGGDGQNKAYQAILAFNDPPFLLLFVPRSPNVGRQKIPMQPCTKRRLEARE